MEANDQTYKLVLKAKEGQSTIAKVKEHLSYGERNAFALVLFMYQAIYEQANLIVLDDPISSFDQNKKFAILDMLFIRNNGFRGKTVVMLTHDFEPVIDSVYTYASYFQGTPRAAFLENVDGSLIETEITRPDILSSLQIAKERIQNADNNVTKAIFLRRYIQITDDESGAWDVLSSLLHKRITPTDSDGKPLSKLDIQRALTRIKIDISDFDYANLSDYVNNDENLIYLYDHATSYYEKLQFFRMLFEKKSKEHVSRKFINETYHIENDYLFQLNPSKFNTIPKYIIDQCDIKVDAYRQRATINS